jgi:hypothetical protein
VPSNPQQPTPVATTITLSNGEIITTTTDVAISLTAVPTTITLPDGQVITTTTNVPNLSTAFSTTPPISLATTTQSSGNGITVSSSLLSSQISGKFINSRETLAKLTAAGSQKP